MASDTNIKSKHNTPPPFGGKPKASGLTLRILAVNVVAPLVLMLGFLYMSQYRDKLIQNELATLKVQARLFAGALAEGAVRAEDKGHNFINSHDVEAQILMPDLSRRMIIRLGQSANSRIRIFTPSEDFIGDSHKLEGPGDPVHKQKIPPSKNESSLKSMLTFLGTKALDIMPKKNIELPKVDITSENIKDYPGAREALKGEISSIQGEDTLGNIILTASSPIEKDNIILGAIVLTKDSTDIESQMTKVHYEIFGSFLGALSITIFLSIYLSGLIGKPLKRLAFAAEAVRQSKGRDINIPDLSYRNDEIGELSMALRDMTQALWDRMDTIERFAADVAHEIKNPLTSLRSAVETAAKVKNKKDRTKLMEIIQHDVLRLDRLISDISNASRLDAELSRERMGRVDMRHLLTQLVDARKQPLQRGGESIEANKDAGIALHVPKRKNLFVNGNESRLAQVFDNLINNALSFSPPNSMVNVSLTQTKSQLMVQVEDEGPGIPDNRLENIFERFYSERPQHETYGSHSGLGLSIAKQIINAHNGQIYAENIKDNDGKTIGACFTVTFDVN